jgi:hypothetical protein
MMLGWECRATGMKPETVDRHVRKEAAGRDAATSAWAEAAVRLRTAATEAVAALPAAPAHKRRALEAAIEGGDADSSAHRRALRDAGQKARKKAMGHSPRGHQKRLMARFPDLGPFVMALVTQMGGRATERRDSDHICIKSTYRVIASIVSARFGVCISAPRFKANKEPASDADRSLMRDNLFFECEQIALSITHQTAYGNPVAAVVGMGHDEHLGSAALSEHRAARNAASTAASESGRKSTGTSKVPGCSCRPDGQRGGGACSSAACKSCGAQGRPCTLFCACMGKCANPHNTMVLPGAKRLDELNSMYLDDVVALLNPTDIERFSVRHVIRTKYCLQVSTPSASSARV